MQHLRMNDLGAVKDFLVIQISRDRDKCTLCLSQEAHTSQFLERSQMSGVKPMVNPMEALSSKSPLAESDPLPDDIPYRSFIGSLRYLMICTRTHLGFAVGKLSKYCEELRNCFCNAFSRVYLYVIGTQNIGIEYGSELTAVIFGFCNSDSAGCVETRNVIEAYVFTMAGGQFFVDLRSKAS